MGEMHFNEDDKLKLVDFLNTIALHAKFEFNTEQVIKYFKLLAHMQQKIIPKVEANILEVIKVVKPEDKK